MKKILLTFCLIILVIPDVGFTEENHRNHFISVKGGVFVPMEDEEGVGFNVLAGYDYIFEGGFGIGFEVGYKKFEREMTMEIVEGSSDVKVGERIANVEVTSVPILLTAKYHFLSNKMFKPYLGAGLGAVLNRIDYREFNDIAEEEGLEWFYKDRSGIGLDVHGLMGIRFLIANRVSLFAEARYSYEMQLQEKADDKLETLNFGGFYGNGGIGVEF